MRSKVIIGLTAILLTAAFGIGHFAMALQAPESRPGRGAGSPDIRRMADDLGLTEEQKTAIRGFMDSARAEMQSLRNDATLTREQRQERMREITQRTQNDIRSILSVEQQMKAEELRKQAQEGMAGRREEMGDRLMRNFSEKLDLTDSQEAAIRSYREEERAQLQALRGDAALTREQKMEQARTIRQQTQDKIRSTLTAEQQQHFDQLRQQAQERFQHRRNRGPRRGGARGRGPAVQPQGGALSL